MTHNSICERRLRRMVVVVAALAGLAKATAPAGAQIYEWRDNADSRHFANSLEQVPREARAGAKIVVDTEPSRKDDAATQSARAPSDSEPLPDQVNEDKERPPDSFSSGWDAGFSAGWDAGYRASAAQQPVCPAEPQVVLLQSGPPVMIDVPRYDPSGAYYRPPYDGTLTVPFDDGASLGLTHRGQVQDLRARERGW